MEEQPSDADRLCERILGFALDEPGAAFPFSARLARETGWSRDEALRTITEYKRFMALAATAGHEVTPSEAVDAVWHLHLTYTRSYWERLCRDVIGRPVHHEPTRGGAADDHRFREAYAATLGLYEKTFGATPPADLWPPVALRFAPTPTRLVDTRRGRVVPKPRLGSRWRATAGILASSIVTTAAAAAAEPSLLDRIGATGPTAWAIGGVFLAATIAGLWALYTAISAAVAQVRSGGRSEKTGDSGCGSGGRSSDSGSSSGHGGSHQSGGESDGSSDSSGCGASGCGGD